MNDNEKYINYEKLGIKLREQRKNRNLSQEKLSEIVGISSNYLSRIESNNGGIVSLPTLVKICNKLNISPDYVLSDSLTIINDTDTDDLTNLIRQLSEDDKRYIATSIKEFIKYKSNLLSLLQ